MAVTLVLVRHGKAQPSSEAPSDEARRLTPAGLEALEASLPKSLSLLDLPADGEVELWRSPATRAVQTADVVADCIPVREAEDRSSLLAQDRDTFLSELSDRLAERDEGCVVCVGHVPFMVDVAEQLSGARLPFSPGAVCAIQLDTVEAAGGKVPGRLLWFVQGPQVA